MQPGHACAVQLEQKDEPEWRNVHVAAFLHQEVMFELDKFAVLQRAHALATAEKLHVIKQLHPSQREGQHPVLDLALRLNASLSLNDEERAELTRMQTRNDREIQALRLRVYMRQEAATAREEEQFVHGLAVRLAKSVTAYFERPAPPELLSQAVADFKAAVAGKSLDALLCAL